MKLNISERLIAMGIFPKEGAFSTLRITRKALEQLGLSEEEHKEYGIKEDGGKVSWDPKMAAIEKEIPLGNVATSIIVTALKKLNDEKKLTQQQYSLYEKFVGVEEKEEEKKE